MIKAKHYKRALQCSAAFAAVSLLAAPAFAGNATISTTQTTPVTTSKADGVSPGDVTITASGGVSLTSGTDVTVNSSNNVTNNGTIQNSAEQNATGILVSTTGDLTGNITNNGAINIPGPAGTSPLAATPVFNTGILVTGPGTLHGSIVEGTGSTLTVGGNTTSSISIFGKLDGSFSNAGTITNTGDSSFGVQITAPITGSFTNTGTITAGGQMSVGVYAGGNITGAIVNSGSITSGANQTTNSLGNTIDARDGAPGLWVAANAAGIFLDGDGITQANEASGAPAGSTPDSNLTTIGGAAALYIGTGGPSTPQDITIGTLASDPSGSSILLRGNITSSSATAGSTVGAVYITGSTINSTNYHVIFTGPIQNQGGDIIATSIDAPAATITIGNFVTIPSFINSGSIHATATDSSESDGVPGTGGGNAFGITIAAQSTLSSFTNSGVLTAESHGATQSAYAISDNSGTLTNIVNTGTITASVLGSGSAIAFDLSTATANTTVTNSGNITGDMLFGSGSNTLTSTGGQLSGQITMLGAGNDTVNLTNTTLVGNITFGTGANNLSATGSTISGAVTNGGNFSLNSSILTIAPAAIVSVGNTQITNASTLNFDVDGADGITGLIKSSGTLVFGADTKINTILSGAVSSQTTVDLIEAQTLVMQADLSQIQPKSTIMYNEQLKLAPGNPNTLQFSITRNTASQLGLTGNQGAVYEGIIPALDLDEGISDSLSAVTDRADFIKDLEQLMPDDTGATRLVTLSAQDIAQSAIRRRLDGLLRENDDPLGRYRTSWWVQEYTTYGSKGGETDIPGYNVIAQSLAAGVDSEIARNVQLGFALNETLDFIQENAASRRNIDVTSTGFDIYARYNNDIGYIEGIGSAAYNTFSAHRHLDIDDILRDTGASWEGNQLGGAIDIGTIFTGRMFRLTPYLRASYTRTYEQAYHESGGGDAVDLRYTSTTTPSERAGSGFVLDYLGTVHDYHDLDIDFRADYAHEFKNDPTAVRAEFASAGSLFTVQGTKPGGSVLSGGFGASLTSKQRSMSLDYDAQYQGGYLAHRVTFTYRQRF